MANNTTSILKCDNCHNPESKHSKLLLCARCKVAKYCNTQCQQSSWAMHKPSCLSQNYIIKFSLLPTYIKSPSIHRTISCPSKKSFESLHQALQIAFGWADVHTFDFKIHNPEFSRPAEKAPDAPPADLATVLAYINFSEAERRGRVRGEFGPRKYLLRIVDGDPEATDKTLYEREIGAGEIIQNKERKHPQTPEHNAKKITLGKLFEDAKFRGADMEYEYDFGDSWAHDMEIVGMGVGTKEFECLDGEGHGAAENAGSWKGWLEGVVGT